MPELLVGAEVLDQHVGPGAERREVAPALGVVEVEDGAALVGVAVEERERAVRRMDVAGERRPQASRISAGRFDLDDVGAEVREQASGQRAAEVGQVDDPQMGERRSGGQRPPTGRASRRT
jgi:hypothetical protein